MLGALYHRHPRSLLSYLVPLLTAVAPFAICEFIKDAEQRSRALRGARVINAAAKEGAWQMRNMERQQERAAFLKAAQTVAEHGL